MKSVIRLTGERDSIHDEIHGYGLTCTVKRERPLDSEELRKFAGELVVSISSVSFRYGAKDVGHIKIYIGHGDGFLRASTLGDPADVTVEGKNGAPATAFTLVINSVLYGLSRADVQKAAVEAFNNVLSAYGMVSECGAAEGQPSS